MRSIALTSLIAPSALWIASIASAFPLTWDIEGQVGGVYDVPYDSDVPILIDVPALTAMGVVPGAPYKATVVLEAGSPDGSPESDFGSYSGVLSMSFSAGSYSVTNTGEFRLLNVNIAQGQPEDMIANVVSMSGPSTFFENPIMGLEVLAARGTFP